MVVSGAAVEGRGDVGDKWLPVWRHPHEQTPELKHMGYHGVLAVIGSKEDHELVMADYQNGEWLTEKGRDITKEIIAWAYFLHVPHIDPEQDIDSFWNYLPVKPEPNRRIVFAAKGVVRSIVGVGYIDELDNFRYVSSHPVFEYGNRFRVYAWIYAEYDGDHTPAESLAALFIRKRIQ